MTRFEPCLVVKRLVVKRRSEIAYDEGFHSGVNIIRGANSSGKSTILNFIFFGLGGDLSKQDWSEHALLCDYVWLEVEFNGKPAVLRREIDVQSKSGMEIFGGRYEDAVTASAEGWKRYPYARSKNLESFSQALFRLLEMPDVAVEGTSNITIHQVLRLLYGDQLSPIDSLFRFEGYDPENLREAVGNLLCGAFDAEIYELQQLRKVKERDYTDSAAELRSIFKVVGGDESLGLSWIEQKRKSLVDDRNIILAELALEEEKFYTSKISEKITLSAQRDVYNQVRKLQIELQDLQSQLDAVEFEMSDSESFIVTLKSRLESLRDAELASSIVHTIRFGTCPACYAEVLDHDHEVAACHLCKTPLDSDRARDRVVGMINEISIQIKQSERLQSIRLDRQRDIKQKFDQAKVEWSRKSTELAKLSSFPTSKIRETIRELQRKLGYLDRSIEDTDAQVKLANKIGDLSDKKSRLDTEIQNLSARIDVLQKSQTEQLRSARSLIEKNVIAILKGDLKRQDSFEDPQRVDFSFAKNIITVDDHTYFSASSRVVLKTAFLVGFLAASLENRRFRHPRFLMIDITEDKGMELERSHNFQRQVINISAASPVDHQIILATAMPAPDIQLPIFVGKFSTLENGTLNFIRPNGAVS